MSVDHAESVTAEPVGGLRRAVPMPDVDGGLPADRDAGSRGGRVRYVVVGDLLAVYVSLAATYLVAHQIAAPAILGSQTVAFVLIIALGPSWIAIFAGYRLYERQVRGFSPPGLDEVSNLFHALLAGSLLLLVCGQVLKRLVGLSMYTPIEAVLFLSCAIILVPAVRGAIRSWLIPAVSRPRRTLIVGAGPVGQLVERKISGRPEYGLDLVGYVDDLDDVDGTRIVGRPQDLTTLVEELEIDWIILTFSRTPYERLLDQVRAVRRPEVHLSIVPSYFELFASNATIEDVQGMPLVSLPPMVLSKPVHAVKRIVDVGASGLGLLALSPLLVLTALAIKLDSRGPVFFRQLRRGRAGSTFEIVKFRTMVDGAEGRRFALAEVNEVDGPLFKLKSGDPRITRVGGFLRRTSLDELPQLWNVLRGQMSLVGPRPFVVHESDKITGWAGRRLDLTPGITGLWQVLGRNDLPFDEMTKLDYVYVTNWSLWWDVKILFKTIPVLINRRGAY